jgi:hypothetical protein
MIASMLARSLGAEKSASAVEEAALQLGLLTNLDRQQALRVLELIAQQPGLVGIAARFAKSRVHLVWETPQN